MTTLGVVVIGLNEGENLRRCLASIRKGIAQCANQLDDVLVTYVDSHSTDGSVDIGMELADQVFLVEDGRSAAAGRMVGLHHTAADWLLFLDGDMELHAQWLADALLELHEVSWIDGRRVAGAIGKREDVYLDPHTGAVAGGRDNVYRVMARRRARHFGGALFLRRSVVEAVGGYRPNQVFSEDPDLHARLLSAGYAIVEEPIEFVRHYTTPPSVVRKIIDQVRWNGRGYFFGRSLWLAVGQGYTGGLCLVFPWTAAVWIIDVLAMTFLVFGYGLPAVLTEVGLALALLLAKKPKEFILARLRLYGAAVAFLRGCAWYDSRVDQNGWRNVKYKRLK